MQSNLSLAEERFQQALALAERLSTDQAFAAYHLDNLATVNMKRGDLAAAEERFRRALALHEKLAPKDPDPPLSRQKPVHLAMIEKSRRRLAKADEYLRQAQEIFERSMPEGYETATLLIYRAKLAAEAGRLELAETLHRGGLLGSGARTRPLVPRPAGEPRQPVEGSAPRARPGPQAGGRRI